MQESCSCRSRFASAVLLYYYDQMFTLCYTLHLLFTRQYVHNLKLHVTEQENVHFEPKFTDWPIGPLADSPARTLCQ